eukprot:gene13481-4360_t
MATCSRTGEALLATLVERMATRTKSNDKMAQREEKFEAPELIGPLQKSPKYFLEKMEK